MSQLLYRPSFFWPTLVSVQEAAEELVARPDHRLRGLNIRGVELGSESRVFSMNLVKEEASHDNFQIQAGMKDHSPQPR